MADEAPAFPQSYHDFYKTNGGDYGFATDGPSLTRQEFADECDINSLMARYEGHVIGGPGNLGVHGDVGMHYADFTQMPSNLQEYMTFIDEADKAFMTLPANVRREFDNSAYAFVEFATNPDNLPRMREWGLAAPEAPPERPIKVEITNPTPNPDPAK